MELMENEEIKLIDGYENYYISSFGRVWSIKSNKWLKSNWRGDKRINSMYLCVSLSKEGKSKSFSIHRLVANAFIPNPNNYSQVNHKDEDKSNNKVDNLEWCDNQYNMTYGNRIQKAIETKKEKGIIKKVWQCDKKTHEKIKLFETQRDAARELGYEKYSSKIGEVCRGIRKSTMGYYWCYDENEN